MKDLKRSHISFVIYKPVINLLNHLFEINIILNKGAFIKTCVIHRNLQYNKWESQNYYECNILGKKKGYTGHKNYTTFSVCFPIKLIEFTDYVISKLCISRSEYICFSVVECLDHYTYMYESYIDEKILNAFKTWKYEASKTVQINEIGSKYKCPVCNDYCGDNYAFENNIHNLKIFCHDNCKHELIKMIKNNKIDFKKFQRIDLCQENVLDYWKVKKYA